MTTGALSPAVYLWIYAQLEADSARPTAAPGGTYPDDTAPSAVTFPYLRVQSLSGVQTSVLNGTRILGTYVFLVECIAKSGTWASVQDGADLIYRALHQKRGSQGAVTINSCVCEEEMPRAENADGVRYRYLGWRVRIEATT